MTIGLKHLFTTGAPDLQPQMASIWDHRLSAAHQQALGTGDRMIGFDLDGDALAAKGLPGSNVFAGQCDVSRAEDVRSALQKGADRMGGFKVIVEDAGVAQPKGNLRDANEAARRTNRARETSPSQESRTPLTASAHGARSRGRPTRIQSRTQ